MSLVTVDSGGVLDILTNSLISQLNTLASLLSDEAMSRIKFQQDPHFYQEEAIVELNFQTFLSKCNSQKIKFFKGSGEKAASCLCLEILGAHLTWCCNT